MNNRIIRSWQIFDWKCLFDYYTLQKINVCAGGEQSAVVVLCNCVYYEVYGVYYVSDHSGH